MFEEIGKYSVMMTETGPYSVFVFENGQPIREAYRRFYDRNLAVKYFDKLCERLEKEVKL